MKKKNGLTYWLIMKVLPCYLPTIFTCLLYLFRDGVLGFNSVLNNGEIVLAAFLLTLPVIVSQIETKEYEVVSTTLMFFFVIFEVFIYSVIRTSQGQSVVIIAVSALCTVASLIISFSKNIIKRRK